MSVDLWFAPTTRYPGGFKSTFSSRTEALAQAAADLASGREPAPVRLEDDGKIESVADALAE
jgi:hypothetical protein